MKRLLPWGTAALLAWTIGSGIASEVEVTGERVNLRAAPTIKAEIVGQAQEGDRFAIGEPEESGWMPVAMPQALSAWVYEPLAKDGVVQVSKLQLRAGPGINYKVLGMAEKGQALTVRSRKLDWLEVAPTPECRVWISAAYVKPFVPAQPTSPEASESSAVATAPAPPPVVEPPSVLKPAAASVSVPRRAPPPVTRKAPPIRKPPMPADGPGPRASGLASVAPPSGEPTREDLERRRLALEKSQDTELSAEETASVVSLERDVIPGGLRPAHGMAQGQSVEYAGRLRRAGFIWNRPARYRVVGQDDKGRAVTIGYLLEAGRSLDPWLGKEIVASGPEYWVQGLRLPVLMAQRVVLAE